MKPQKVKPGFSPSFPRKRESSNFTGLHQPWIPVFTGMTSFCDGINLVPLDFRMAHLEIFGKALGRFGEHLQIAQHRILDQRVLA